MCGNPKVSSVSVFRNPNRTVTKKSNPKFGFPWLFWKPKTDIMKTDIKIKSHNLFPMYITMFVYNGVILIMMTMKLQYH